MRTGKPIFNETQHRVDHNFRSFLSKVREKEITTKLPVIIKWIHPTKRTSRERDWPSCIPAWPGREESAHERAWRPWTSDRTGWRWWQPSPPGWPLCCHLCKEGRTYTYMGMCKQCKRCVNVCICLFTWINVFMSSICKHTSIWNYTWIIEN